MQLKKIGPPEKANRGRSSGSNARTSGGAGYGAVAAGPGGEPSG